MTSGDKGHPRDFSPGRVPGVNPSPRVSRGDPSREVTITRRSVDNLGEDNLYNCQDCSHCMPTQDPLTSISVHSSTVRLLRELKTGAQTWDDLLRVMAQDYVSPTVQAQLERQLRTERIVSGTEVLKEHERLKAKGH